MQQASLVLNWFAFALYIGATVLYAYQFVLLRAKVVWWARLLTGSGFICHSLSIGLQSWATGTTVYTGANQLILVAWALVFLYFVVEHVLRVRAYGTFLIPIAVAAMAIAQMMGGAAGGSAVAPNTSELTKGWWIGLHVAFIVFAYAGFTFGGVASAMYLRQMSALKRHKTTKVTRRMPSLTSLQNVARRSIALAYPLFTAGLLFGIIQAVQKLHGQWWLDPRIMLAGFVWVTFGAYLVVVYRHGFSSRLAAWTAVGGMGLVTALAVLARTLANTGFHVFGA